MSAVREDVLAEIEKMSEPELERVLAALRGKGRPLGPGMTGQALIERSGV